MCQPDVGESNDDSVQAFQLRPSISFIASSHLAAQALCIDVYGYFDRCDDTISLGVLPIEKNSMPRPSMAARC